MTHRHAVAHRGLRQTHKFERTLTLTCAATAGRPMRPRLSSALNNYCNGGLLFLKLPHNALLTASSVQNTSQHVDQCISTLLSSNHHQLWSSRFHNFFATTLQRKQTSTPPIGLKVLAVMRIPQRKRSPWLQLQRRPRTRLKERRSTRPRQITAPHPPERPESTPAVLTTGEAILQKKIATKEKHLTQDHAHA